MSLAFPATLLEREQVEFEADLAQTIIIGGVPYACVAGSASESVALEMDGFTNPNTITATVRQSLFTTETKPAAEMACIYGGVGYRIDRVEPSVDGVTYNLTLVEPQK